jgi:transketolase
MDVPVFLVPARFIQSVASSSLPEGPRLQLIAALARINTLSAVKLAGSGHLGSSLSAMDIVVWLYYHQMNTAQVGFDHPDRDVYFSSKGHDVPGLYSLLYGLGIVSEEKLLRLRKLDGLDGHPNVRTFGIEANSGSLGMGISKGRGMAWAKKLQGHSGWVYVLTGDGELQEGQNFEALQTAVHQGVTGVTVIVDHNKLQTDKLVSAITDLGDLEAKFASFGWEVGRCDGHDMEALAKETARLQATGKPHILIADTIKGKGISFMEHPAAVQSKNDLYAWHSGAPADEPFLKAQEELLAVAQSLASQAGLGDIPTFRADYAPKPSVKARLEFVAQGFGDALVELATERPDLVVLDGDLSADCKVRPFETIFPERFVENGIAEQDMVSMAGGMARMGLLPVVNSFASFLASRANEQIYTNACEGTKIIYGCHFAGMIPAGPGKSHQSVRDIGLLGSIPNLTIYQPMSQDESRLATRWAILESQENVALRLCIGPSPRRIELPGGAIPPIGQGILLREGKGTLVIGYGPVMLHEILGAAETLSEDGEGPGVMAMPWLNRIDGAWLASAVQDYTRIIVVEDHMRGGGLGERLASALAQGGLLEGRSYEVFGLDEYPECGTPLEVLGRHQLDAASLTQRISGRAASAEAEGAYTDHAPQ